MAATISHVRAVSKTVELMGKLGRSTNGRVILADYCLRVSIYIISGKLFG